jgi:hypothetical protein
MKPKKLLLSAFRLAVVAAFASVATLPLAGQGDRDQLKGAYFITGDTACLVSQNGFNGVTPKAGAVYSQSGSAQGIFKLEAGGTGTGQVREVYLTFGGSFPGASSDDASFQFNYTVGDEGMLTFTFGLVSGTFSQAPWPFPDVTVSLTPPQLSGRIARNGTAITLTSTDATPETLTVTFPAPIGTVFIHRICYRTRILIPIHVGGED